MSEEVCLLLIWLFLLGILGVLAYYTGKFKGTECAVLYCTKVLNVCVCFIILRKATSYLVVCPSTCPQVRPFFDNELCKRLGALLHFWHTFVNYTPVPRPHLSSNSNLTFWGLPRNCGKKERWVGGEGFAETVWVGASIDRHKDWFSIRYQIKLNSIRSIEQSFLYRIPANSISVSSYSISRFIEFIR